MTEASIELDIETYPSDHVAVWIWERAPEGLRELLKGEHRYVVLVPRDISIAAAAAHILREDVLAGRVAYPTERTETGDGALVVGFSPW